MKYKNLIILMILIIVWSLFFAVYKYFMWWVFASDTITLQYISWYLSLGTIWAYIIWWLVYELFRERKFHIWTMLGTIIFVVSIYFLNKAHIVSNYLLVWWITVILGFFYGMWSVLKNILISSEINESWLWDTKVNWLANIFFISALIIGSIWWGKLAEIMNINWLFIIIIMLVVWLIAWLFLSFHYKDDNISIGEKATTYKRHYLRDFKFIIKKYIIIMIFIGLIITIATILSQKAIEYNVEVLKKSGSSSAFILLYSAVGSIIWNILSMSIKNNRWLNFLIFSILFAISCYLFPIFINNFNYTWILALIAWLFFWITYNLLEAYFFKKIADDDKKSFWSATLGIIISSIIYILMTLIDKIQGLAWFAWVYTFMSAIILAIWIIVYTMRKSLD